MKPRNFERRLSLNKKTISNLNNGQMGNVNGGGPGPTAFPCEFTVHYTYCGTCPTEPPTCNTCVTCATCDGQNTCDIYCPATKTI